MAIEYCPVICLIVRTGTVVTAVTTSSRAHSFMAPWIDCYSLGGESPAKVNKEESTSAIMSEDGLAAHSLE